jgi:hypothetical protein
VFICGSSVLVVSIRAHSWSLFAPLADVAKGGDGAKSALRLLVFFRVCDLNVGNNKRRQRLRLFALKLMPGKPHSHTGQGWDCEFEWHLHTGRNSKDLGKMEKIAAKTHTKKTTRPYYVYGLCDLTGKFCASAVRNPVAALRSLKLYAIEPGYEIRHQIF